MNEMWFALVQEEQLGPMSFEEVIDFYYKDIINAETLLWTDGLEGWCAITQIKEFSDLLFQGAVLHKPEVIQNDSDSETSLFHSDLPASFTHQSAFASMDELKDEDLNADDIAFLEEALVIDNEDEPMSSPQLYSSSEVTSPPAPNPSSLIDDIPLMSLDELVVSAQPNAEDSSLYQMREPRSPSLAGQPSLVSRPVKKGGGKLLFLVFSLGMAGAFFFQDIQNFANSVMPAHVPPSSPPSIISQNTPEPNPLAPTAPTAPTSPPISKQEHSLLAEKQKGKLNSQSETELKSSAIKSGTDSLPQPLESDASVDLQDNTQDIETIEIEEMVIDEEIEIEYEEPEPQPKKVNVSPKKSKVYSKRKKLRKRRRKAKTKKNQKNKAVPQSSNIPSQLGRSDIESARSKVLPAIQACATKDPKLGKHLSVVIIIMRTGKISQVKAVTRSLRESSQKSCVLKVIRSMKFQPFSGENMRVTLPIKL